MPEHDPELLAMVRSAQATWANADIPLPKWFNKPTLKPIVQKQRRRRRKTDKQWAHRSPEFGTYWRNGGVIDRTLKAQTKAA